MLMEFKVRPGVRPKRPRDRTLISLEVEPRRKFQGVQEKRQKECQRDQVKVKELGGLPPSGLARYPGLPGLPSVFFLDSLEFPFGTYSKELRVNPNHFQPPWIPWQCQGPGKHSAARAGTMQSQLEQKLHRTLSTTQ